jgi:hypothetical protein
MEKRDAIHNKVNNTTGSSKTAGGAQSDQVANKGNRDQSYSDGITPSRSQTSTDRSSDFNSAGGKNASKSIKDDVGVASTEKKSSLVKDTDLDDEE